MQLTGFTARPPLLVQTLEALAHRPNHQETAESLLQELSGITVLVAKKFSNERTVEGLTEAYYLTIGCISLALSQADTFESNDAKLTFLLKHGAEHVFQMGFRHIKELSGLPYVAFVSDFDKDAFVQQRNVKALFSEICHADPSANWTGDEIFNNENRDRLANQTLIDCAKWLRKNHYNGAIKDADLDANAVIAIAVIFAILNDGRIVARTGQKEIESLISRAREAELDIDAGWKKLLKKIPLEYHAILLERMDELRGTIIKKIQSKAKSKTVLTEIQDYYAGNELDVEYP
jgi:hypothetical protein